jgi:hypothetical protein
LLSGSAIQFGGTKALGDLTLTGLSAGAAGNGTFLTFGAFRRLFSWLLLNL